MFSTGTAPVDDPDELGRLRQAGATLLVCDQEVTSAMLSGVLDILAAVRPDIMALADDIIAGLPALDRRCTYFSGMAARSSRMANCKSLRRAVRWLARGGALLVYPAGERSHWAGANTFSPVTWSATILRGMRLTGAAYIPVFARDTARACRVVVRLGEPTTFESLSTLSSESDASAYLRRHADTLRDQASTVAPGNPR